VGEFPGTTLEFIPQVGEFTRETFELMSDMSAAANRPLNWNLLQVYTQNWDNVQHQLTGGDIAAERGGRVLALTLPDSFRLRINFTSGFVFDILNGWDKLMALPVDEKLRQLRDPATRAEWDRIAQSTEGSVRAIGNWAGYVLLETFSAETKPFEGRVIGDVAKLLCPRAENKGLVLQQTGCSEARLHWIIFVSLRAVLTLFIAPLIDRLTSEFAITNKRVIVKLGLISIHTLEMNLSKVESINVDQNPFGRIFGYGSITVIGIGATCTTCITCSII
jgi:hypothetical protein